VIERAEVLGLCASRISATVHVAEPRVTASAADSTSAFCGATV
jgi:hypothetical protein